jgi:putative heme-binding domain-containing protein
MGPPDETTRQRTIARFDGHFPAGERFLDGELCQMLVFLQAPSVAEKAVRLMELAPTQEEQIEYARSLRKLKTGWTGELRKTYFSWFLKANQFSGGASFALFMANIKRDAVETLSVGEKTVLEPILQAKPELTPTIVAKQRPFVKKWTLEELGPLIEKGMTKRDFDRGRRLFGEASCFACHRFNNEGGSNGPDLTGLAGRFSVRDLLESIVDPSKVISDQYQAVNIETTDGRLITGRIVNLNTDNLMVNTNMLNPGEHVNVDRKIVESMEPSKVSMMPTGLLDTFKEDEILDLMAFLLSRGDRNQAMFR